MQPVRLLVGQAGLPQHRARHRSSRPRNMFVEHAGTVKSCLSAIKCDAEFAGIVSSTRFAQIDLHSSRHGSWQSEMVRKLDDGVDCFSHGCELPQRASWSLRDLMRRSSEALPGSGISGNPRRCLRIHGSRAYALAAATPPPPLPPSLRPLPAAHCHFMLQWCLSAAAAAL